MGYGNEKPGRSERGKLLASLSPSPVTQARGSTSEGNHNWLFALSSEVRSSPMPIAR